MIRQLETRALSCSHNGVGLHDLSLVFGPASFNLLTGPEDSGKELLLRLLGLLERPCSGEIFVQGAPTSSLDEPARAQLRNLQFGYLFSAPFLLPSLSILENVAMPLFRISNLDPMQAHKRMDELLDFVGMTGREQEGVELLTPRDQQRVALARGLANGPSVLFIENLDAQADGAELHEFAALLRRAAASWQTTVIATASRPTGVPGDRIIELVNGRAHHDSMEPFHD